MLPVNNSNCPGWWLNASVCIDRINVMSSATSPKCGSNSDSSIPDLPCGENLYRLAITFAVGLMNANFMSRVISGGSEEPSYR